MADRRPNARLVEAPGAGHNLLRDPNVIDTVEHFLDEARVVDTHPGH